MNQEPEQHIFIPNLLPELRQHDSGGAACKSNSASFYASPPASPQHRPRHHYQRSGPGATIQNDYIIQKSLLLQLPAEIRNLILVAAFGHRTIHADLDIVSLPDRRAHTPPATELAGDAPPQLDLIDLASPAIQWQPCSHLCHRECFPRHSMSPAPVFVVDRDKCSSVCGSDDCAHPDASRASCHVGALGWLLTCRQAYMEGIEVLYRSNMFRLNESFALENMHRLMPPACASQITQLSLSMTMGMARDGVERLAYPRPQDTIEDLPYLLEMLPTSFPSLARLHLVIAGEIWPERQLIAYCAPSEALHADVEGVLALLGDVVLRRMRALRYCEVAFDSSVYFPWVQTEQGIGIDFKDYADFTHCPYSVWRPLSDTREGEGEYYRPQPDRRRLSGVWVSLDAWDAIPWSVITDLFGNGPW